MKDISFPSKLKPLLTDDSYRYYVLKGGRASGKSWSMVRVLLVKSMQKKIRILCVREFQTSIAQSVHRLICDQITSLDLDPYFDTTNNMITCTSTGSEWIFAGIKNDPTKVKSTEGIDYCFVEEAETISARSWEILIPTIRKPNSKFFICFNPMYPTDATWNRFVINTPPGTWLEHINYTDNVWCPQVMLDEAEHCKTSDPEKYKNIWLGQLITKSETLVFSGKYSLVDFIPQKDWNGPYIGVDFGFAKDPSTMVKCWIHNDDLYIEKEAYGIGVEINDLKQLFTDAIPDCTKYYIRADSARPETISHLKNQGFNGIQSVRKWPGSIMDGIAYIKGFKNIYIHTQCKNTYDEISMYMYKTDKRSGDILPEVVDENNHIIDALRYALEPMISKRRKGTMTQLG